MGERGMRLVLYGLAGLGVAVRLWIWWNSTGSNDAVYWYDLGNLIHQQGLAATYAQTASMNHPPLMGLWAAQAFDWSGGSPLVFSRLMKVPALAGEAIILAALLRWRGPKTMAAYALLPAPILISAFHCNTDCLYVAFLLLAAIAFDKQRYLLSGGMAAASLNVKLLPILLVLLMLIALPSARAAIRFCCGLALAVVPFLPLLPGSGAVLIRRTLLYNSVPDNWGPLAFLNPAAEHSALVSAFRDSYIASGRYLILAAIVALGFYNRREMRADMTVLLGLGGATFLVLAPGFGIQYIVLVAPFLFFVGLRQGLAWGWVAGVFAAALYETFRTPGLPLRSYFTSLTPAPAAWAGFVAWDVLAAIALTALFTRDGSGDALDGDGRVGGVDIGRATGRRLDAAQLENLGTRR